MGIRGDPDTRCANEDVVSGHGNSGREAYLPGNTDQSIVIYERV